ncbi:suppressor APC domain-containing protein 2-like isoform X2 [Watersipora subatra]|uniref:suppressor APC domain-containing protein 2-like isoform X1 n=1 Tax=Watersipora subatra TaxID=2589382 RepID=UPI00355C9A5D
MTYESLPKQFLSSVRVLFDVLDSKKQGYVDFNAIEAKWNKENTCDLPVDVLDCLRDVALPNGHLTFELFVTGLQRSLTQSNDNEAFHVSAPPLPPQKSNKLTQRESEIPYSRKTVSQSEEATDPIYQKPARSANLTQGGRSQSIADIPAQPITSPQHRPIYKDSDAYRKQIPKKKDSSRRHTLGHGVDGSMVRRSKLLEEERRMLLTGLQAADKARDWYKKRLTEVAEKQRYGAPETSDQSTTDQHQERINFEDLRITELNQQIDALTEPSAQGGLMRMNLARPKRQQTIPYERKDPVTNTATHDSDSAHAMELMRAQNRMLTKEVSQKGDKIAQLEKDKAALLKDLFEVRAKHRPHQQSRGPQHRPFDESTLI